MGKVGRKRLYFHVERVRKVWHVSGFVCFFYQPGTQKEYIGKNKLVVEGMSKYDCPEGIAGS